MLCALCDSINVTDLILLAKANWEALQRRQEAESYTPLRWNHHSRYDEIVSAAEAGCELCKVVERALDGVFLLDGGIMKTYKAEMLEIEEEGGRGLDLEIQVEVKRGANEGVENESAYDKLVFYLRGRSEKVVLTLSLQKRRGQVKSVEGLEIGHFALDPNLGSETNFDIAQDWIDTCSSTHYECPMVQDRPLPTRVIHVGSDAQEPYLLSTHGMKGKYIALSHCWGGNISDLSKLNKTTAKTFGKKIALMGLPPNFRDAILITRGLGFEFLWIDCLCIMQDSSEDWEVESKHMGDVYRDATLTIAAAASSNSTDGILKIFPDYDLTGLSISLKLSKDSPPDDHIDLVLRDNHREQLDHLLQDGPLADRGWTFQEEVLSARTLYYGRMQIYWQCLHNHASADGLRSRAPFYQRAFRYERIRDQIHEPQGLKKPLTIKSPYVFVDKDQTPAAIQKRTIANIIVEYHKQMVVDYCSRRLSFLRDKFPAFSGIVTLVRDILQSNGYPSSKYIAGIWTSHFREGLVWYYGDDAVPSVERAPTWSWATTNGKVVFHPSTFASNPFQSTHIDPELLSHRVVLAGQNPYGEINDALLEIQGSLMVARGMDRVVTHTNSKCCGYIHWDTRVTGKGRRTNALFVCRVGSSAMFLFSPQDEKTSLPRASANMDKQNIHKANNTRYKIMFVATQTRQAHGLILKEYATNQDIMSKSGNEDDGEKMEVESQAKNKAANEADGDQNLDVEAQAGNEDRVKHEAQDERNERETRAAVDITTYRRVGYVRLYSKHVNVTKFHDAYNWADLEGWKREHLVLI
ncbi:putative heterokaryon incompatibility protein [Botrytis fragariae]|uniref:Putative heterokaryon incompatibility protein n=1 Tax=Botrytis fragariae TaxID=1964551 RepID=A0A8H6EI14_9HELO|nr:putative heterokaryon incompatibility protein [Botrytis fragariae]KAF5873014.1 putative heterokaryon incompatibility protein [Botrytis fragariae]